MTRRYLTPNDMHAMLQRQHGVCASPNCMSEGPFEADHSTVHVWDNKKPDQLLCIPCHRRKTKSDVKRIAKVKRITGKTRSQWNGDRNSKPIRSAGFKGWRNFKGEVVRNER